jgi:hypothetical protein
MVLMVCFLITEARKGGNTEKSGRWVWFRVSLVEMGGLILLSTDYAD